MRIHVRDNPSFWQVGSGQQGKREYAEECIKFGMAFAGIEAWDKGMKDVVEGDVVVLRRGLTEIVAVGKVVEHAGEVAGRADEGNKPWLKDFDGWDLSAYCYVEWHRVERNEGLCRGLSRHPFSALKNENLKSRAVQLLETTPISAANRNGPSSTRGIGDAELKQFLRERCGERSELAFSEIEDVRNLARKYFDAGYGYWNEFKEHEIRTFLIVPLLVALGWKKERIKIEVNPRMLAVEKTGSIDVACFSEDYAPGKRDENSETCKLIVETKRFSHGLAAEAVEQAERYAKPLKNCHLMFVSNGYCYKAFERSGKCFSKRPSAYLNLLRPTERYPLDPDVEGALKVLELLLPRT